MIYAPDSSAAFDLILISDPTTAQLFRDINNFGNMDLLREKIAKSKGLNAEII